jgi:hypothetical protein
VDGIRRVGFRTELACGSYEMSARNVPHAEMSIDDSDDVIAVRTCRRQHAVGGCKGTDRTIGY